MFYVSSPFNYFSSPGFSIIGTRQEAVDPLKTISDDRSEAPEHDLPILKADFFWFWTMSGPYGLHMCTLETWHMLVGHLWAWAVVFLGGANVCMEHVVLLE